MQLDLSPKDWERIAYYLHRLAVKEPLRKMNERHAAKRLGNLIADVVSKERNKWINERQRWDKGRLEEFIFKQGKTPEEIARILGTSPEKVEKALRRFNLLQKDIRK
ncbi:unnamed protein product [marine sediment metagenome]|uniref:Uncharacterized protein n=1 Tax=marine sediment metagenome TaxID=412755 RepID=X1VEZ0_9ZZZZ